MGKPLEFAPRVGTLDEVEAALRQVELVTEFTSLHQEFVMTQLCQAFVQRNVDLIVVADSLNIGELIAAGEREKSGLRLTFGTISFSLAEVDPYHRYKLTLQYSTPEFVDQVAWYLFKGKNNDFQKYPRVGLSFGSQNIDEYNLNGYLIGTEAWELARNRKFAEDTTVETTYNLLSFNDPQTFTITQKIHTPYLQLTNCFRELTAETFGLTIRYKVISVDDSAPYNKLVDATYQLDIETAKFVLNHRSLTYSQQAPFVQTDASTLVELSQVMSALPEAMDYRSVMRKFSSGEGLIPHHLSN